MRQKRCIVACDTPSGVQLCELQLQQDATLAAALAAARVLLGHGVIDWEHAPTGVFGRVRGRDYIPRDGDRIEVYRALLADPRERRRQQSRTLKAGKPPGAGAP